MKVIKQTLLEVVKQGSKAALIGIAINYIVKKVEESLWTQY